MTSVHLSVVSPVFNARDCLDELWRRVKAAAESITADFEVILVDDASRDDSWLVIESLARKDPRVRGIRFARNFGQHHAVTAGLAASRGEWIIVLDCDLQDRPEEIPRLYAKARDEGHLCVMGRRAQRQGGALRRLQSWMFYRLFAYLTDIPYDGSVSNYSIARRQVVDDVLRQGVQGISDIITMPGLINLDFADVRTIMSDGGSALMGIGFASQGENRAREAAERALRSPLIDTEVIGAGGILLSIAGGSDLSLLEVNEAAEVIRQAATDDTNIIFGATVDERLNGQVWVTVIATGLGGTRRRLATPVASGATAGRQAESELPSFLR